MTQRVLVIPEIDEENDEPTTELKEDPTMSNEAVFANNAGQIDDTVNGVTANEALQDILLRHRKSFRKTLIFKQMTESGSNGRGSTFMKHFRSSNKSKSPATSSGPGDSLTLGAIMEDNDHDDNDGRTDKNGVEAPLKGQTDETPNSTQVNTPTTEMAHFTSTPSLGGHNRDYSGSLMRFNSQANIDRLKKKWKNPKCNGCGNIIHIVLEGKDAATKKVVTYDCKFVEDLEDHVSSLVYFHDKHCENLRKYKESIRKYVLESQLQHHHKRANNMKNYVKNLLNHKDLLINIHSGELPRPGMNCLFSSVFV